MNRYQIEAFFKYKYKAKYRKGHGIHPPFAFDLVRNFFFEKHPYYYFNEIDKTKQSLLKNKQVIDIKYFDCNTNNYKSDQCKIAKLIQKQAPSKKQGELISRLVCYFKPHNIIELGTSSGINSLYLAKPNSKSNIHTIEYCTNSANLAKNIFKECHLNNIHQYNGTFADKLPEILESMKYVDLVYFNEYNGHDATLQYFNICLDKASDSALFIFNDINKTKDANKTWQEITKHPSVTISFELYHFGITIVNLNKHKQHYVLAWP